MKALIKSFVPNFILQFRKNWIENRMINYCETHSPEEIFKMIYHTHVWGDTETVSGRGSKYEFTHSLREELPKLFAKYQIKSILDIPCGDFNWMKTIDLQGIDYIGADIVEELVVDCQQNYTKENIKFEKLDMIVDTLPKADLIICRSALVHLSDELSLKSLANFRKSGSKYLLITSFAGTTKNEDIVNGYFRLMNLEIEPFNEKIIDKFFDASTPGHDDKYMVLIEL